MKQICLSILTRDSKLLEIWNVMTLIVVSVSILVFEPLPQHMLDYQRPEFWAFQLMFLGVMHALSLYDINYSGLRTWCLAVSGFIWLMVTLFTIVNIQTNLTPLLSFGLASACLISFISRAIKWK